MTASQLTGTIADLVAIPAFWIVLAALVLLELAFPIHAAPREARGRLVSNFGLGAINMALFYALPLSTVIAGQWAHDRGIGLLNLWPVPPAAGFAAAILAQSLVAYGLHVASHKLPLLWRIHRIHHSDTAIDLSTGFRHHPFELLFVAVGHAAVAIALGLSVAGLAAYAAAGIFITLWTHANLRLPGVAERWLRLLFVTPAMHHAHHSAERSVTDSNYGELFSFWDRLFGTYTKLDEPTLRATRFGLGDGFDCDSANIGRQLVLPADKSIANNSH